MTHANGSMWYVKVLFLMCVVSPLFISGMQWLRRHQRMVSLVFLFGALMLGMPFPGFKTYWRAAFYFCVGIGIRMGIFDKLVANVVVHKGRVLLWAVLWGTAVIARFATSLYGLNAPQFWLYAPLVTVPVIWVAYDWVIKMPVIAKMIQKVSLARVCELSFFIYCAHEILLNLIGRVPLLSVVNSSPLLFALLSGGLAFGACCVFGLLFRRYLPNAYLFLTGGRL